MPTDDDDDDSAANTSGRMQIDGTDAGSVWWAWGFVPLQCRRARLGIPSLPRGSHPSSLTGCGRVGSCSWSWESGAAVCTVCVVRRCRLAAARPRGRPVGPPGRGGTSRKASCWRLRLFPVLFACFLLGVGCHSRPTSSWGWGWPGGVGCGGGGGGGETGARVISLARHVSDLFGSAPVPRQREKQRSPLRSRW